MARMTRIDCRVQEERVFSVFSLFCLSVKSVSSVVECVRLGVEEAEFAEFFIWSLAFNVWSLELPGLNAKHLTPNHKPLSLGALTLLFLESRT